MSTPEESLADRRVPLSPKHYVTWGTLIAIGLWMISATAYLTNLWQIEPLKEKNTELISKINDAEREQNTQLEKVGKLNSAYNEISMTTG